MEYTRSELQKYHAALIQIQKDGPIYRTVGICSNITGLNNGLNGTSFVRLFSVTWPNYSEDNEYPVPGSSLSFPPGYAYFWTQRHGDLWNKNTEYGQMRHDLLHHLITTIEHLIEDMKP